MHISVGKDAVFIKSQDYVESGLSSLIISRNTPLNQIKMAEMDSEETTKYQKDVNQYIDKEYIGQIYAIIGILEVNKVEFLVVVNEIQEKALIHNRKQRAPVFLIKSVMIFPIQQLNKEDKEQAQLIKLIAAYFKEGFYFSKGYDLTASR